MVIVRVTKGDTTSIETEALVVGLFQGGGVSEEGQEDAEALVRIVRKAGPERILFGTNFPLGKTNVALEVFEKLPLRQNERDLVGHDNFFSEPPRDGVIEI